MRRSGRRLAWLGTGCCRAYPTPSQWTPCTTLLPPRQQQEGPPAAKVALPLPPPQVAPLLLRVVLAVLVLEVHPTHPLSSAALHCSRMDPGSPLSLCLQHWQPSSPHPPLLHYQLPLPLLLLLLFLLLQLPLVHQHPGMALPLT